VLIDRFTNSFFAVALLTILLTVGWYSFNDYSGYIANQKELAKRSVENTAREIEVLIASRKKSVTLFAQREQKLLRQLVQQPDNEASQSLLQSRVDAYFPNRLAVTVADENGQLLLKKGKKLVGKTCRRDIRRFFTTADDGSIHVHPSPGTPRLHIDILSDTSEIIQNKTVFFVSFFLDDLFRILSHGQVVDHQLTLVRTSSPELIETPMDKTENELNELEKLVGTLNKVASAKPREFRKVWHPELNQFILASTKISDTQWEIRDIAKSGLLSKRRNELIIQAIGILLIFLIITIAGLRLTQRLKVSRVNTNSVLLRIEEDRKRIAMDLHDQVLSDISHVQRECRQLSTCSETINKGKRVNNIERELNKVTKTIRHVIDDLHPHSLSLLGFTDAVRAYCNTHLQEHIDIKLDIKNWEENRLNDSDNLHLFRIIQESIDNVIKHAEATLCTITLRMDNKLKLMSLSVNDNGKGIDILKDNVNTGHGIANIKERSRLIGAKVYWQVIKDNHGTNFVLEKVLRDKAHIDANT